MGAPKVKFEIEQGATFQATLVYKAGKPPVPVDLTGSTARMQVRAKIDSEDVLLELTTTNDRITLGGATGEIGLTISAADTAALTWKTGVYDLELVSPAGIVRRLVRGTVMVSPEVTRGG